MSNLWDTAKASLSAYIEERENNSYEWFKLLSQEFRGKKQNTLKQDKGKKIKIKTESIWKQKNNREY